MGLPDIYLLRAAIALAEIRNYSKAAKRLGIQQPTLTKWIYELESLIGFTLFHRSTQFVEPTESCKLFVEEARQAVFHAERAVHVARVAEEGAQSILYIGKSSMTDPYLLTVINAITLPLHPNLELSLSSMSPTELEPAVLLGKLDLAVAIGEFHNPKVTQLELLQTPVYIVLPISSRLANAKALSLGDLNQQTWLMFERHVHPGLYDSITETARLEGITSRAVHHVITAEEAARELYAGCCDIALLSRSDAWRVARNGLTMRPLEHGSLKISSKMIARANDSSRLVSEFARTLKRRLETTQKSQLPLPLQR